ncbi:hypothetical protein DVH05_009610 [Phytophthora capsici]|nr:hypothetical protein DVH05_009610 [Phytophthora capsici]
MSRLLMLCAPETAFTKTRTYSFMYSNSNGKEQDPHKDYIPEAIANVTKKFPGTIPCSMIVALMPGTRLKVFAECFGTVDPTKAKVSSFVLEMLSSFDLT